jgi:cell division septal protein FtsQ
MTWSRRRIRRVLWAMGGTLGVAAVAVAAVTYGPRVLRELELFRVEQVEVIGTRFLEPYAVVTAAGIDVNSSVFDDFDVWRDGVLALPLVADVQVRRRFPSVVTLDIREIEPVALVADGALRPVDALGRVVALDLAGAALDLPIVVGATIDDDQLGAAAVASALTLLALIADQQGSLADRISQVEVMEGALRLVFRDGGPDALLPLDPSSGHLTQLRVAYADLAARGELQRARRVDLRFRDQVVVSFLRTPVS